MYMEQTVFCETDMNNFPRISIKMVVDLDLFSRFKTVITTFTRQRWCHIIFLVFDRKQDAHDSGLPDALTPASILLLLGMHMYLEVLPCSVSSKQDKLSGDLSVIFSGFGHISPWTSQLKQLQQNINRHHMWFSLWRLVLRARDGRVCLAEHTSHFLC